MAPPSIQEPKSQTAHQSFSTSSSSRSDSTSSILTTDLKAKPPIYVLGLGNLGKLFAHSLATLPNPAPITFLTHRPGLPYAFSQSGSTIELITNGNSSKASGFTIEVVKDSSSSPPISHLIVSTKAMATARALAEIKDRLTADSTVLFTQNGMGALDEVNALVFPDPATRPNYLSAIVVHGVFSNGPFSATHAGLADMKIAHVHNGAPGRSGSAPAAFPPASRYMLEQVLAAEQLAATEVSPTELVLIQLEKLVANACINPLTAVFQVLNGGLLVPEVLPLRKALLDEASRAFLAYLADRTEVGEEVKKRFGPEALETVVLRMNTQTAPNKSSMLQDVDAGRETEVRYINGWFVAKGREFGLDVDTHRKLMELVEQHAVVKMEDIGRVFPKAKEFM